MSSRYVVDSIVPEGEVSILAGASGVGKSTLLLQMLAAIANGEDAFLGHRITYPQRIAYIAADRTWESYGELAERVGVDLDAFQTRSLVDDTSINVDRLESAPMDLLYTLIMAFDRPSLVVVDPMVIFLGVDPNRYQQVAPRLIKLARWCRAHRMTILATHHATKARSDYSFLRPQDRISGSGALLGFTSSQLFLASPEEIKKPYSEFTANNHNSAPETLRLVRGERGLFQLWEPEGNTALGNAVIVALTKVERASKTQLQAATRIDPHTLEAVLDGLIQSEMLKVDGKGQFRLATATTH